MTVKSNRAHGKRLWQKYLPASISNILAVLRCQRGDILRHAESTPTIFSKSHWELEFTSVAADLFDYRQWPKQIMGIFSFPFQSFLPRGYGNGFCMHIQCDGHQWHANQFNRPQVLDFGVGYRLNLLQHACLGLGLSINPMIGVQQFFTLKGYAFTGEYLQKYLKISWVTQIETSAWCVYQACYPVSRLKCEAAPGLFFRSAPRSLWKRAVVMSFDCNRTAWNRRKLCGFEVYLGRLLGTCIAMGLYADFDQLFSQSKGIKQRCQIQLFLRPHPPLIYRLRDTRPLSTAEGAAFLKTSRAVDPNSSWAIAQQRDQKQHETKIKMGTYRLRFAQHKANQAHARCEEAASAVVSAWLAAEPFADQLPKIYQQIHQAALHLSFSYEENAQLKTQFNALKERLWQEKCQIHQLMQQAEQVDEINDRHSDNRSETEATGLRESAQPLRRRPERWFRMFPCAAFNQSLKAPASNSSQMIRTEKRRASSLNDESQPSHQVDLHTLVSTIQHASEKVQAWQEELDRFPAAANQTEQQITQAEQQIVQLLAAFEAELQALTHAKESLSRACTVLTVAWKGWVDAIECAEQEERSLRALQSQCTKNARSSGR